MRIYHYRPLSDTDFTRLLVLHPSTSYSSPLQCQLVHCQQKDYRYDALSYAWGAPQLTKRLYCPDTKSYIAITASLDIALRHLRHGIAERRLWVDAVCINQTDGPEKARQIRGMTRFYKQAQQVIAWVGEGFDSGEKVLDFFQEHEKIYEPLGRLANGSGYTEPEKNDPSSTQVILRLEKMVRLTFGQAGLEILAKFFLRSWFQRRWIIQEIVMAQKAKVQCGNVLIEFGRFAVAAGVTDVLFGLWAGKPFDPKSLMHSDVSRTISAIAREHGSKSWRGMVPSGSRFPIHRLLSSFRSAQCFDDRDRIYGLLGICDDLVSGPNESAKTLGHTRKTRRAQIEINYKQSVAEVYTNLALAFLRTMRFGMYRLSELLQSAGAFRPVETRFAELPSWIPDWRAKRRYMTLSGGFEAGRCSEYDNLWSLSKDNKMLRIKGWHYATVAKRTTKCGEISTFNEIKALVRQWMTYYKTVHPVENLKPEELVRNPAREWYQFFDTVVMRRLLWDGNAVYPPWEFVRLLLDTQVEEVIPDQPESTAHITVQSYGPAPQNELILAQQQARLQVAAAQMRLRSSLQQLISLMEGRTLCISSNGELMSCPNDTRIGDTIAVFAQVDMPFVLRPVSVRSGTRGREKMYRLIGDCYVEGIMVGELETTETLTQENMLDFLLV
ncbi:heterokaryon incompatibility protein-domain-containing protein [Paraphoma chrysanthemicola]|nr:heterokaryon incompatibility protein-domain-containing protein [Paraphoma chrysanthemicola]